MQSKKKAEDQILELQYANLQPSVAPVRSLDLSNSALTSIPSVIFESTSLRSINLSGNRLTSIPEAIGRLQNLVLLDLSDNWLTDLPNEIDKLQNLRQLYLQMNKISKFPTSITRLNNLELLNLSANHLTDIPESVCKMENLQSLFLVNNPIQHPPLEIASKGISAIRDYFRQITTEGEEYLYEAKLLIVGEGGAGKTTLAKKLKNSNYQLQDETSTQGIDVVQWYFSMADGKKFRVNIWDFGGQEIYHATHQFFLTKRSLYILVADTRKEDTDFYYWLNVVELLSDNSPLIIVKNEKQDRHREINERQLRGQFSNFKEVIAVNLATNRGLETLLSSLKYNITQLPHIGSSLPSNWVQVRHELENDPRNYISLNEYLDICEQYGFEKSKDKLQLSSYLHDLGTCLHFQDDSLLKRTIFLRPEWCTTAVYKVLDNPNIIRNLGHFSRADLEDAWDEDDYINMRDEILQLMLKFKLCYQVPGDENTYIAPQLLTQNQPAYEWPNHNNLYLRFVYEFMPKGILTQFIVAMHPLIVEGEYLWKSGVVLRKNKAAAEVIEHYGRREISIRIIGKHKRELLTILTYELDKIHRRYPRLKYDKLIPCNCSKCKKSRDPHFYPFEVLRRFIEDHQQNIQCQKSYQMVSVLGLIDDVMSKFELNKQAGTDPSRDRRWDGLSPDILNRLRNILKQCGPFDDDLALQSIFVDARVAPWRDKILAARTKEQRVDAVIVVLCKQFTRSSENALVAFLHVLCDHISPIDACHRKLSVLANELEDILVLD